jgi:hypothetical protein
VRAENSAENLGPVFPDSEKPEFFASASGLTEPMKVSSTFLMNVLNPIHQLHFRRKMISVRCPQKQILLKQNLQQL